MKSTIKSVCVKTFSTERAGIKVSFSEKEIVTSFQDELKKRFQKEGFQLSETENDAVTISGEFVMINEGNQFLRWFIGPFGVGSTKLEIEGSIHANGKELEKFNYSRKGRGGLFGGNGKGLLKGNAAGIAKDIVKLLTK